MSLTLIRSMCILLPDHLLFSFFALTQASGLFLTSPTNFYPGSMTDRKFILLSRRSRSRRPRAIKVIFPSVLCR
ncbi:uncharacterized protein HD556DRAFT_1424098 [Suillus plorans]|uniref:Uncharacterized protein n=1 Tax=Suillus plorans TaxID=116603 RepID=A0A9P7AA49_9AGAM|nr:uncharacterized protein HD556DRAFT_1424098 [Suillus plorans]KAG1785242.1 hypothetical protein HD556DRAFT_1424098 [Suillus plorans]